MNADLATGSDTGTPLMIHSAGNSSGSAIATGRAIHSRAQFHRSGAVANA